MSRIRGKNTKIEIKMKELLKEIGIKYQKHPKMFGNPDFVVENKKIAIFCDGDFWHGYNYRKKRKPSQKFWHDKINRNMERDIRISRKLRRGGWSVLRFWEHDVEKRPDMCIGKIKRKIKEKSLSTHY